ncbi:hypothetical protein [Schaalia suimastitidis]|uniref:hypothetical protein n=1 Tax=Schaalia suimastitidis TaxID=121163 RepID=UPI0003FF8AB1|nr:hypothetical protein [Schaalia suimastitidis]
MLRVVLFVAWLAVILYAIADWARTPQERVPGPIPRMLWLVIIIITAPTFAIGAVAWVVTRWVSIAEERQGAGPVLGGFTQRGSTTASPAPVAPDDDPEFLFKLQRDIQRQRSQDSARDHRSEAGPSDSPLPSDDNEDSSEEGNDEDSPTAH